MQIAAPRPDERWLRDALRAIAGEAVVVRPLLERNGQVVGIMALPEDGNGQVHGFWTLPVRAGTWLSLAEGRDPYRPEAPATETRWSDGGWEAFLAWLGERAVVGDDWARAAALVANALRQRDAGARDRSRSLAAIFSAHPQVDIQETAAALGARNLIGPGPYGLAELAARVTPQWSAHEAAWRAGRLSPFIRLRADALVWSRLLRPALEHMQSLNAPVAAQAPAEAPAPKAVGDWRALISRPAPDNASLAGLAIWFPPDDANADVLGIPFANLRFTQQTMPMRRDGENRRVVEIRPADSDRFMIRMDSRSARHLVEVLGLAIPMDSVFRLEAVRFEVEIKNGGESNLRTARSVNISCETSTEERALPGPALRLSTIPPRDDSSEGLDLLLPLADASPLRLRAQLEALLEG